MGEGMKTCAKCKEDKPLSEFYVIKRRGRSEPHSWCKLCCRARNRKHRSKNEEAERARVAAWRAANPEKAKAATAAWTKKARAAMTPEERKAASDAAGYYHWIRRLAKVGWTEQDYWDAYERQDGKCAICRSPDPGKGGPSGETLTRFPTDHCHTSGAARGLLCQTCNRGLGYFKDNPDLLRAAAGYLESVV